MEKLWMCGKNSVKDALKNNFPLEKVFVLNLDLAHKFRKYSKIIVEVKDRDFFKKYSNENHQGVIAYIKEFPIHNLNELKNKNENILVLDHIQDPHNLGAIIRSANIFGFKHIIIAKNRATDITSTALKISSGGFVNINFYKVNNIASTLKQLKQWNYWVYVSTLEKNSQDFSKIKYNHPSVLVIGNENAGVSQPVIKQADILIHIPQKGSVQSLNASVAAGLLLYQLSKE